MASGGTLIKNQKYKVTDSAPRYLHDALGDIGVQEWVIDAKGRKASNPVVLRWIEKGGGGKVSAINTPWCAYYVGAKLEYAGIPCTKDGMARSYLKWGAPVKKEADWRPGDVVVIWRGEKNDGATGHIFFFLKADRSYLYGIGGNQSDKVSIQKFSRRKLLGVRRPRSIYESKTVRSAGGAAATEGAKIAVETAVPAPHPVLPSPDAASQALESVRSPLETLASFKPVILALLSLATLACIGYAAYCRYRHHRDTGS